MKNNYNDIVRMLAQILETHVEESQSQGLTPLLDGIAMAKLVRAIANRNLAFKGDMRAAAERMNALINNPKHQCRIMAPDVHWPTRETFPQGMMN